MTTPTTQIDPVNAFVTLLAAFLSPALAAIMGAYSVIFISAAFGSGWALMRRGQGTLPGATLFIVLMTGTATLTTVGVAEMANHFLHLSNTNLLLGPVALLIGGVGQDWPKVVPTLFNLAVDFVMSRRQQAGNTEESH